MGNPYIKEYFKFTAEPIAYSEAVVQGKHYRFTIITSRMVRMEFSETGEFEDRPTQTIWFRKQPVPEFIFRRLDGRLSIQTDYLELIYAEEKPFSATTLQIKLKQSDITWKFGKKGKGNLKGTARTLDATSGPIPLKDGYLSKAGYSILDDSQSLVFNDDYWPEPRSTSGVDQYFLGYGRDYLACLDEYYKITGKTPLIPRFILGNWWSRYWEYDEKELKELIETFQKHKIPLSVCIIDMDWHLVKIDPDHPRKGWTGYTWNKELFPDPPAMLKWLRDKNLKVSLNLHPAQGIRQHEDCYQKVADYMGVDKEAGDPIDFDIADPKFASAYFDLVHHPHEDLGVDFWWLDWQQGKKTKVKGLDPLWMLNHLHFLDLGRDGKKRPFIFSRWGQRGNHRYPIGFSGDTLTTWKALKFQPYFTATASNIGYGWWSHDIGGHAWGKADPEIYTRWVQYGVFSPILRLHSTKSPFMKREPWLYDYNTLKIAGDYMRLRHHLIPYIYTYAYRNFAENIPLIRPLYYYHPYEPCAYKYKQEYWFGDQLLISPIVKPVNKKTRRVIHKTYLPQGVFFDYFNNEYFEGNRIIERAYQLSDYGVFAKAGAIIPLNAEVDGNCITNPKKLAVDIFPGESNVFDLYEDDGESVAYKQGEHYITTFLLNWEGDEKPMTITIEQPSETSSYIPKGRTYTLRLHALDNVGQIKVKMDSTEDNSWKMKECRRELNGYELSLKSNKFTRLEITIDDPKLSKLNLVDQNAFDLLQGSEVSNLRKRILHPRMFEGGKLKGKIRQLARRIALGRR